VTAGACGVVVAGVVVLLLGRPLVGRIDAHGEDLAGLSARLFGSEEAKAAMQAFLNRRK
jgi:enoyl-CoA hydratase/methylglutaconyl-CoA hydratase